MKGRKRRSVVLTGVAVVLVGVLGYAWVDGGREPVRDITVNLPVPRQSSGQSPGQSPRQPQGAPQ